MGGSYTGNAGVFLIETLFGLYILAVMLRFLLQWVRADFYNPLAQVLVKVTNPPLIPLRRIIPGFRGVDFASILLMLVLQALALILIGMVKGVAFQPAGLIVLSFTKLLSLMFNVFFFSILIQVIISWISPGSHNPVVSLVHSLNEPLMRPVRRIIPPISGLDLSPLVVMIGIQLCNMLIIAPLSDIGRSLLV
ncbi:MAG: YggT family protein [Gammaproteobacteria bacterium]|nr:YggT family protein [Gammaproteobacteria bacterium]